MRIRTKLTILLLSIALVPMLATTGLGTMIMQSLNTEVAREVRHGLTLLAREQLLEALAHYSDILTLEGHIAELRRSAMGMPGRPAPGMNAPDMNVQGAPPQAPAPQGAPGLDFSGQGSSGRNQARTAEDFVLPMTGFADARGGMTDALSVQVMRKILARPVMRDLVVLLVLPPLSADEPPVTWAEISDQVDPELWRPGTVNRPMEEPEQTLALVRSALASEDEGSFEAPFRDRDCLWAHRRMAGIGEATAFMILPRSRFTAASDAAEADILEATGATLQTSGLVVLVAALTVVFLALFSSRRVTGPVEALAEAARRVAEGDFEARAGIDGSDELARLGRTFDAMVPRLQDQMHMQQALELASEIQQRLLPRVTPTVDGIDMAAVSISCDETGGDYYDFLDSSSPGPGRIATVVGDVTGHGVSAALLMATARGMLRAAGRGAPDLARRVCDVNALLCQDVGDTGQFMTLFAAELDRRQGTVRFVRAGHDPALLYDPGTDSFQELSGSPAPFLGIVEDFEFELSRCDGLIRDQVLVLGTDGIWETFNPENEMYGKQRLEEIIRQTHGRPAEDIVAAVIADVDAFRRDGPVTDDVTLMVIKFTARDGDGKPRSMPDRRAS